MQIINKIKLYYSKIKSIFSKNKVIKIGNKEVEFKIVYKDSFGNIWRAPNDLSDYPFIRLSNIQTYSRYTELKLDKERLLKIIDTSIECLKRNDTHEASILLNEVKIAESMFCEKQTLLKLASAMFLINDEKPNSWNEAYEKLKIDSMLNDADCMAFFLPIAYQTMSDYKNNSELQVVDYLTKIQNISQRLEHLLKSLSTQSQNK